MIEFNHEGKIFNFRNKETEITLKEFSKVSEIMSTDGLLFEKWLDAIDILGDEGLSDVITEDGVLAIIKETAITNIENEVPETVTVNGREYVTKLKDGKLSLSGKDLSAIERAAKKGGDWGCLAIAICYKDTELSNTEHYTEAHIKHKANLFGEHLTAKEGAPIFFQLQQKFVEHMNAVSNAYSKPV